jgi:hypothetical protein
LVHAFFDASKDGKLLVDLELPVSLLQGDSRSWVFFFFFFFCCC